MKKVVFVCHDPGGYDAVRPVYELMKKDGIDCIFFPLGPSAKLAAVNVDINESLNNINSMAAKGDISVLVTGTSWGVDYELDCISICDKAEIKTVSILDYWSNYKMRFYHNEKKKYVFPQYYFVMDELAKKEAIGEGVPEKILEITGSPGLDKYVDCQQDKSLFREDDEDVLFLSQPLSVLYGDSLGYTEKTVFSDVAEVCKRLGKTVKIKFHPKDDDEFRQAYKSYEESDCIDIIAHKYSKIVGMNTMALLQLYLIGGSVINYQPGLKQPDLCITNILGITKRIDNKTDLAKVLLENDGKTCTMTCRFFWQDGKSTWRVFNRLKELMVGR